jgi:hypothetical protein
LSRLPSEDPRDKRLRSSIYVESAGVRLGCRYRDGFSDAGPLRENIRRLDAVVFTTPTIT